MELKGKDLFADQKIGVCEQVVIPAQAGIQTFGYLPCMTRLTSCSCNLKDGIRLMLFAYTGRMRTNKIHVISARDMSKKERHAYAKTNP